MHFVVVQLYFIEKCRSPSASHDFKVVLMELNSQEFLCVNLCQLCLTVRGGFVDQHQVGS